MKVEADVQLTVPIDEPLVRRLVQGQFPDLAHLAVRPVATSGWDNRTFRLGEALLVRLPSAAHYAAQVDKEHYWLPRLAPLLPLEIPAPVRLGRPAEGYPWNWSVYRWLDGENAALERIADRGRFARSLAAFLIALHGIDASAGPTAGEHNFGRGGALSIYAEQTRQAIDALRGQIDSIAATQLWDAAASTGWCRPPVWIHGDVSAGNLLVRDCQLSAVIDFGQLGVGDPACDLSIAWTLFEGSSRAAFRAALPLDRQTWARGRAWTLWKALIVAAGLVQTNACDSKKARHIIDEVLVDHRHDE